MPARPASLRPHLLAGGLLLLVLAAVGTLPGGQGTTRQLVYDLAFVLLPSWAALSCVRAARHDPASAVSWRLLAAACTAWAAGSVVWGYEQLVLGDAAPFPSWADAGYLAWPLLAVAGLLRLPGVPVLRAGRLRLLLDGVVVSSSLLVLAWLGAVGNLSRTDGSALAVAVGIAFPVLDVLVGSVVLVLLDRLRRGLRDRRVLVALAVAGVAAADALYAVLAGRGDYVVGGPCDLLYVGSFLLLAAAARGVPGPLHPPASDAASRLLPLLPAVLAGAALLLSGRLSSGLGAVLTGLFVALVGALVGRQVLLGVENEQLSQDLERKVAERTAELAHANARAGIDPLTGLPNRTAFTQAVQDALDAPDDGGVVGLVLLDLDGFKEVNDGFGHDTGDALLLAVADRLRGVLRGDLVLARLGGDEFAVLVRHDEAGRLVATLGARLVASLAHPFDLPGVELVLGGSAGTVVAPRRGGSVHHLLRDADTAMYAAKAAGRGQVRPFDGTMHAAVRDRVLLEADLRQALADDQLEVHYQPVVDLLADRVAGFEALARWTSPTRGPVPPSDFVPAAERTGLVVELERRVLELACAQVAVWRRTAPSLTVAVNVSARHLSEPSFLGTVLEALARHSLPPSALVVEVTESLLFHDDDVVKAVLAQLHTAGVGLALDDFGTGYSSLSRLASYPFDILKIDRAFVGGLDGGDSPVLVAALAMAQGLGMTVVAEGVETEPQLDFLLQHGCGSAQGYLLSRPGPASVVGSTIGRRLLPSPRSPLDLPNAR